MILSVHAVIGVAVAQMFPENPILAFGSAFLSHFIADALPHWDYALSSKREDKNNVLNEDMEITKKGFVSDLLKIGLDAGLGLALAYFIFQIILYPRPIWLIILGATSGILPDILQFAYWKFRREPLKSLQRFHFWIHTKRETKKELILGLSIQAAVIILIIFILK